MCGFIAILQSAPIVDIAATRRALNAIAHRGPDASDEWREGDVFLGHRRLSIIDLTTGDQPMQSIDGRYVIVFNGEIYNFVELRELLVREGATCRTRSDTEVILQGYHTGAPVAILCNLLRCQAHQEALIGILQMNLGGEVPRDESGPSKYQRLMRECRS